MEGITNGFTPQPGLQATELDPEFADRRKRKYDEVALSGQALSSRAVTATSLPKDWQKKLIQAAGAGDIPAASALLKLGADPNAYPSGDSTPLWHAARNGHAGLATLLLAWGADINAACDPDDPEHPIRAAMASGNVSLLQFLIGHTNPDASEVAASLFLEVAKAGNVAVMSDLLERTTINIDRCDDYHQAPISAAAQGGHLNAVTCLLERGANINTTRTGTNTPITRASSNGHHSLVEFLLDKGADITAGCQRRGYGTPIREAAKAGHLKVVQLLLARGANIDADSHGSGTPLSAAAAEGRYDVVEYLLEKGASVNERKYRRVNPISLAVVKGHLALISLLLDKSALIDSGTPNPLWEAANTGRHDIVEYLCQRGANTNIGNRVNCMATPIWIAAARGYLRVVRILHQHGANIHALDTNNTNALSIATNCGHQDVANYLEQHGAHFPPANQQRAQASKG